MLFIIQFPFVDTRLFLNKQTDKLSRPVWPIPDADEDFIRSFGAIRLRRRGGLTGWVGENSICEANKALRFENLSPYIDIRNGLSYQPRVAFRRLYFDGLAVGKFEVGLAIKAKSGVISKDIVSDLLFHFLDFPVTIPFMNGRSAKCELIRSGRHIAKLWLESSTKTLSKNKISKSWVKAAKPMFMILHNEDELSSLPFWGKTVEPNPITDAKLSYYRVSYNGKTYPTWVLVDKRPKSAARALRIYIARLHAERECLRQVLEDIATATIKIKEKSQAAENLQHYLNTATHKIVKLESKTDSLLDDSIGRFAKEALEIVFPGEREEIISALENINIRRNILHKVESFVKNMSLGDVNENLTFPQADAISDEKLRLNVERAIKNININSVDLGLFDLARILENEIRLLLESYRKISDTTVTSKDLSRLENMIDCAERIGVIRNKHDIHFLRQERNRWAHEGVPDLYERNQLMRHAPFLGDLYIRYISLFSAERMKMIDRS